MAPPWHLFLMVALVGAIKCPDGRSCGGDKVCCALADGNGYGCCTKEVGVSRSLPMITTDVPCTEWAGCPEEYSCVGTPEGVSACCPLAEGASCQDGHHCCPSGSKCSEDGHFCIPATNQSAIICPDGTSECPSDATCCQMSDQRWGCCPLQQAVCCQDHVHCCPQNTACDLEHGTCTSKNGKTPMFRKLPARMKLLATGNRELEGRVTCRDNSSCPDGSTCCERGETFIWMLPVNICSVPCNDTASCPASSTCCRLASGEWGCCPYENAMCCPDHEHCCPSSYTCGASGCMSGLDSIPWLKKTPALKAKSTDVPCDPTTSCPDNNTCCRLASGEWGCCPIVQAVCCADHQHCCPSGYTCDVSTGTCNKPDEEISVKAVTPVKPVGYVWCDSTHACYDGQTCCIGPGSVWTCCPYPSGVCCPDRVHCCPYGHICLAGGASCSRSASPRWDLGWRMPEP
ncbi:progranulin [Gastrophryne carolinensis]